MPNPEVSRLIDQVEEILRDFNLKLQWIEGIYSPPTQLKGNSSVDGESAEMMVMVVGSSDSSYMSDSCVSSVCSDSSYNSFYLELLSSPSFLSLPRSKGS